MKIDVNVMKKFLLLKNVKKKFEVKESYPLQYPNSSMSFFRKDISNFL